MSEPSVEEIVVRLEASCRNAEGRARNIYGEPCDDFAVVMPSRVRALIADWRKRGERIAELEPYESLGKALKILSDNGMGRFS